MFLDRIQRQAAQNAPAAAELQGWLDHKHGMGYSGHSTHPKAYQKGWREWMPSVVRHKHGDPVAQRREEVMRGWL